MSDGIDILSEQVREIECIDPLWENVQQLFPYQTSFPWKIFPKSIAESLLACAESCATSPTALAGVALATLASTLGRMICVSPKPSWKEPVHLWFADIRESGEGKTPAMQLLAQVLHRAQELSDKFFEYEKELWAQADKKTRGPEPKWSRSYFVTALTLEGIRSALKEGHGGILCILSELSSFITGQGQYKSGKGDDREVWLVLHDGSVARIIRVGNSLTIQGARVSICGGIQPEVFRIVFSDKNGLYLTDGTIFRFLVTYEPPGHYVLTRATWSNQHREVWENLIKKALQWADKRFDSGEEPLTLILSDKAWECFSNFRNSTFSQKSTFPPPFRGFIPKATSYVLRLAGLLHCFEQFSNCDEVLPVIGLETIKKAIIAVKFYLGHTLEALKLLNGEQSAVQCNDTNKNIISVLESLNDKVTEQGYITVGDIAQNYNAKTGENQSPRAMGSFLRGIGLEPKKDPHRGTYEIRKQELQDFLKTMSAKSVYPQYIENITHTDTDNESESPHNIPCGTASTSTLRTLELKSTLEDIPHIPLVANVAEVAEVGSTQPGKSELFNIKKSEMEIVE